MLDSSFLSTAIKFNLLSGRLLELVEGAPKNRNEKQKIPILIFSHLLVWIFFFLLQVVRACVSTPGVMPTYPLVAIPPVPCPFFSFIYLFKVEKKEKKNKRQGNRCAQHLDTRASSSPTVFIFIF